MDPIVELAPGRVKGSAEGDLAVFRGIPYAGPNEHEMNLWRVLQPALRSLDEDGLAPQVQLLVGTAAGRPDRGVPCSPAGCGTGGTLAGDLVGPGVPNPLAQGHRDPGVPGAGLLLSLTWTSPAPGIGSCHGLELPFVFGTLDSKGADAFAGSGPAAETLATRVQDAWLSFARTGDPGWPAYDRSARATMLLGEACEVVDDPLAAERLAWDGLPTA